MSKTMKKIGSIFAAATLVGATLTGAMAVGDLKDLPAPFVKNGMADVAIVVGQKAATADVLGSIDIASALQASSVTTTTVNVGGSKSSAVEDGVKIETSGNALLLGETLNSVDSELDDGDLPDLLADGSIEDEDDSDELEYEQTITPGTAPTVKFDASDTDMDDPVLHLDLDNGDDILWTYDLNLKGSSYVNLTNLDDSETVTMLGRTFTFAPDNANTGEIKLFGSDKTEYLTLNQPKTFTVDGKAFTVEITGGNSDNDNVVVSVNGVSKVVEEGDTQTINGLEIFAKDVFVTNIPTLSAAATLFIGSEEIILQEASSGASWSEVEIGGETVNGLEAWVEGTHNNGNVVGFHFRLKPTEFAGDLTGFDETNWLESGDSVADPLFGTFEVLFNGGNYELEDESKSKVEFVGGADELTFKFTNEDGDEISFEPYQTANTTNITVQGLIAAEDGWIGVKGAAAELADGDIFAVNEGSSPTTTSVFEVVSFTTEDSEDVVRLKNLGTGETDSYGSGDEIVDGVSVDSDIDSDSFTLSAGDSTTNAFYVNGGENYVTLPVAAATTITPTITEVDVDQATAQVVNLTLSIDGDGDLDVAAGSLLYTDNDEDNDYEFSLSAYGTYIVNEIDESDYANVFVPQDEDGEVHYEVFFAPTGSSVVSTGGSSSVTTTKINPIAVGAAVLDSSVNLASEAKNLIVVGGPCANSVAASLLKTTADSCGAGFTPGKAIIQLFDTPMGKTAMLVAGYEATETQAASRAVALMDKRLMGQSVTLTATSSTDFTVSTSQ